MLRRCRAEGPTDTNGILCEISLPRLGKVKGVRLCEIEPYSYERSSKNANCQEVRAMIQEGKENKNKINVARQLASETKKRAEHVAGARNDGKEVDAVTMGAISAITAEIKKNKKLWGELRKYSRERDGIGVSFLMGINPRSGVPFECMSRLLVGKLWLAIREHFLRCNIEKLKGDKFTNVRVSIESEDTGSREFPRDVY